MIKKIKEISKAVGLHKDQEESLIKVCNNVKEKGVVSSLDMQWIICSGIPGFTILASILKVSKSDAHTMCSRGQVTAENFEEMINIYHETL